MDEQIEKRIRQLKELKQVAAGGGGEAKIAEQHAKGKLTARERIDRLLDPGSFAEVNMLIGHSIHAPAEAIIAGHGTIDGRQVCVYSQDATVLGGSGGAQHTIKMTNTIKMALDYGVPLIGMLDSVGARVARRAEARDEQMVHSPFGSIFYMNTQASGVVPQMGMILGTCAGFAVYSPILNDFVFTVDKLSHMFITGPRVVKSVIWEDITKEDLGGAKIHAQRSGVADFRVKTEEDCFEKAKKLLSFLPSNNREKPPHIDTGDDPERLDDTLAEIVPADSNKAYDMRKIVRGVADNGDFLEVKAEFAPEMLVGFVRLDGSPVGIVANQPLARGGCLTVDSSDKEARFIRFCDCFNIPLVFLIDTPAYQPGSQQEHAGIIRHGAKVLYALSESVVPRVNVQLRKCYGGGSLGMGLAGFMADFNFAWPIAEAGVLGARQSVDLYFGEEIAKAENPEEYRQKLIKEYQEKYSTPFEMASNSLHLHDVIEPRETRKRIIRALRLLRDKQVYKYPKRHGNMPM